MDLITGWSLEPSVIAGLLVLYGGYLLITIRPTRVRPGGEKISAGQLAAFTSGVVIFTIALLSPLDALADRYSFTAHMVQHLLLTIVAPPLLILGTPGWVFEPLRNQARLFAIARWATNPYAAFISYNFVFAVWHAPALYNGALQNDSVHILEHLSFIFTATLAWMPLTSPSPLLPRLAPPVQVLYLFLQSIPPTILGAVITFAPGPIYPFYAGAPRLWGVSVMEDQLYAGLVMWNGGAFIFLFALTIVFFKWFNRQEPSEGQGFI